MTRLILALLLTASPALACDFNGSTVTGVPVIGGMDVVLHNRLVAGRSSDVCHLYLDGEKFMVIWFNEPGEKPDHIIVVPPLGYTADPAEIDLAEDATATIQVREWTGY